MTSIALIGINFFLVFIFCVVRFRSGRRQLLDPAWAFLLGYAINYCLRPALFLFDPEVGGIYQDYIYPSLMIRQGVSGAILFSMLGLAGFAIGDKCFQKIATRASGKLHSVSLHELAKGSAYGVVAFVFLALGAFGLYGFVSVAGWTGTMLELFSGGQRDAFMQVIEGHGYYTFAMQLSLVGWAMICARWVAFTRPQNSIFKVARWGLRGSWFVGTLVIWLALGERASMITVLFIPVALYLTIASAESETQRIKRRRMIAGGLVAAICSVLVAGPIGLLMKGKEVNGAGIVAMAISAWDSFEFTIAAQNSIQIDDLFLGQTYVSDLVYTWFPRSVFPHKPERYGAVLVQDKVAPDLADSVGATFPTGFLVEAFANFWYLGVFVIPLLLGILFQLLTHRVILKDWFWIIQAVLLFPNIASFRSVGWCAAALAANVIVVGLAMLSCLVAQTGISLLRSVPILQPAQ